ncbi:MAG: SUMF1/EgtB/PvdO family nonheme iron enzyme [Thermoguttaceae bacterium]|nr:SUMF1/EgtB/PvdO family nonheme iron enzyme [Thermoguttaceae bacterium]
MKNVNTLRRRVLGAIGVVFLATSGALSVVLSLAGVAALCDASSPFSRNLSNRVASHLRFFDAPQDGAGAEFASQTSENLALAARAFPHLDADASLAVFRDVSFAPFDGATSQDVAPQPSTIPLGKEAGERLTLTIQGVEFAFRWVPAQELTVGSADDEPGREADEARRQVRLTQGFWMQETETTQAQWLAMMRDQKYDGRSPRLPAFGTSYYDAQRFLAALNAAAQLQNDDAQPTFIFRLPTEAEFEAALRAGTKTTYFWGDSDAGQRAVEFGNVGDQTLKQRYSAGQYGHFLDVSDGFASHAPVGSFKPNAYNIFDLNGNVAEWTSDWRAPRSEGAEILVDPTGPVFTVAESQAKPTRQKVIRGGHFFSGADECRSASRGATVPYDENVNLGFRITLAPQNTDAQPTPPTVEPGEKAGDLLEIQVNGVPMRFRWVPAGTYAIGSPENEPGHAADETPRQVQLTQGLWVLETEVSQRCWFALLESDDYDETALDFPAHSVTWFAAQDYIASFNASGAIANGPLSQASNKYELRLLTEAEWEIACRAGSSTPFCCGSDPDQLPRYGNVADMTYRRSMQAQHPNYTDYETSNGDDGSLYDAPVGRFQPNAWGLYDMHGNVREWVADYYGSRPSGDALLVDPTGPDYGDARFPENVVRPKVLRGGLYWSAPSEARSAARYGTPPTEKERNVGFRVALAPQTPRRLKASPKPTVKSGTFAGERLTLEYRGVEFPFRWVPAGDFQMGSPSSEEGREKREKVQNVRIPHGFWIMEHELTIEQLTAILGANARSEYLRYNDEKGFRYLPYDRLTTPATNLDWFEIQRFIRALNEAGLFENDGEFYFQTPTGAQFEYACRAGTQDARYNESLDAIAWFAGNVDESQAPRPVKGKLPNAWGLYDTLGNVEEWVFDTGIDSTYVDDYIDCVPDADFNVEAERKIFETREFSKSWRGGAAFSDAAICRAAWFYPSSPIESDALVGFRLVLNQNAKEQATPPKTRVAVSGKIKNKWTSGKKKPGEIMTLTFTNKTLKVTPQISLNFCWIPGGKFTQGSPIDEIGRNPDEIQREVEISGFWLAQVETPRGFARTILGEGSDVVDAEYMFPLRDVSRYDARFLIDVLNANNLAPKGLIYALPTEAQWEYACRGGSETAYYWGDRRPSLYRFKKNFSNSSGLRNESITFEPQIHEVFENSPFMSYEAQEHPFNLLNMTANVSEWVRDDYSVYSSEPAVDPVEKSGVGLNVVRGGSYVGLLNSPTSARSAERFFAPPGLKSENIGFRLALVPDDAASNAEKTPDDVQ